MYFTSEIRYYMPLDRLAASPLRLGGTVHRNWPRLPDCGIQEVFVTSKRIGTYVSHRDLHDPSAFHPHPPTTPSKVVCTRENTTQFTRSKNRTTKTRTREPHGRRRCDACDENPPIAADLLLVPLFMSEYPLGLIAVCRRFLGLQPRLMSSLFTRA